MKYAILQTNHPDYNSIIEQQRLAFDEEPGATNYEPILNIAGTQALINVHTELPKSECIICQGGYEIPLSRVISEWTTKTEPGIGN